MNTVNTIQTKNYKLVEGNHEGFWNMCMTAWEEIGITPEFFPNSEKLVVHNAEGKDFGTIEFTSYNKGQESVDLEALFNFRQFQSANINLFYMDKVTICKEERGKIENMYYMMQSMFVHMEGKKENGKERVIVGLVRKKFFRYLKRMLCVDIIQIGEEQEGEIPMMIKLDDPSNLEKLESNTWSKVKL